MTNIYMTARQQQRIALRDKLVHYEQSAESTACGQPLNFRLATYEPQTLTCKKCRKILATNPAWRRHWRNW